jgi:hypothetical protein
MPDHTVKPGDTLIRIAHTHGFRDWAIIWNHARNEGLRSRRADPQSLVEGDVVHVPEKELRDVEVATNKRHTFVAKTLTARFEAVLLDERARALTDCRYELEIAGRTLSGRSDGEGRVAIDLPPDASRGWLKAWPDGPGGRVITWNLRLGHLEPIETTRGVQGRLANLGYYRGPLDGAASPVLEKAVRDFQIVHGVETTGAVDAPTRDRLVKLHDGA